METDWIRSHDPAPEVIWRQSGKTGRIDGGILNLDGAFISALRQTRTGEVSASATDLPSAPDSTGAAALDKEGGGEGEKSMSKAPTDDPQDWRPDFFQPLPDHAPDQDPGESRRRNTFDWNAAFRQSMFFLAIEHTFRLATEDGTRADLKGPFFKDYFRAVRSLRGWAPRRLGAPSPVQKIIWQSAT